uniref:Ig-like domain-containing protein n=1 Tax=Neogobius melanostomus TaxID=47308 RepID=A0A8C6SX02_9GOBI
MLREIISSNQKAINFSLILVPLPASTHPHYLILLIKLSFVFSDGALSQEVVQLECVKRAKLGDAVVLKCLTHSMWRYRVWYKQATNKTLQHLSSADYKYTPMVTDHRYFTESSAMETNLTILQMTEEDVGTYYCGIFKSRDVVFGSGTCISKSVTAANASFGGGDMVLYFCLLGFGWK